MPGPRSVSAAELKAECVQFERDVLRRGLATEADLEPHRPGKEKNSARDARGWLRYFAALQRIHGRGDRSGEGGNDEQRIRADAEVLKALRDEPIRVDLLEPVPFKGETTTFLFIFQKSFHALVQAHALDRQLAWLLIQKDRVEEAGARGMPGASELLERVMETIAYTYGLLAWIMTAGDEQGRTAAMPYEPAVGRADPVLPEHIRLLHPLDVAQIANASQKHHARLASMQVLLESKSKVEGGRRPTWSQFFGSLAIELDTDSVQIQKYRSLGSLLASVQLDADAKSPDEHPADATRPAAGTLT